METFYITVGPEVEIELPAPICEELGIVDGTRIGMRVDGGRLILKPEATTARETAVEE